MKKKFFVVAASMVMTMAVACPAMADVITDSTDVDKTVESTGWWQDFSDYYKLSGNFDVTFTIDNKGGAANWNNAVFVISTDADRNTPGYSEYAVVRMDAAGWGTAGLGYVTSWGADWDSKFIPTMKDATITYNVKRVNNQVDIHADIVGANGMTLTYDVNVNDYYANDLRLFFVADTCKFTVNDYKINEKPADTDTSYSLSAAGWWQDFSPYYTCTGDFTRSFYIKNKGGVALWNNPVFVVTNNFDRNTTGYSEYAVMRSDSWSVVGDSNVSYMSTIDDNDEKNKILADAEIYLTVTRSGNTITFSNEIVGANGKSYNYDAVLKNDALPETIRFFLSADGSSMSVYEDTKDANVADAKTYAQYKANSDGTYTVRVVSEVAIPDVTAYSKVGFRCAKVANKGENYLGTKIYKSIKANGKTVTAGEGKYFVILEITNVKRDATLYVEPTCQKADSAMSSFGKEVTVNMNTLVK